MPARGRCPLRPIDPDGFRRLSRLTRCVWTHELENSLRPRRPELKHPRCCETADLDPELGGELLQSARPPTAARGVAAGWVRKESPPGPARHTLADTNTLCASWRKGQFRRTTTLAHGIRVASAKQAHRRRFAVRMSSCSVRRCGRRQPGSNRPVTSSSYGGYVRQLGQGSSRTFHSRGSR